MAFPFSASFERSIKTIVTSDNKDQILFYIKKSILDDKADNVVVDDMTVRYKGSTSVWNFALFRGVDDGIFSLICKGDKWFLYYHISLRTLIIGALIASCLMEILSLTNDGPWWMGTIFLFWPFGVAWFFEAGRHGGLVADLANGIDQLTGAVREEPQEDKMTGKLKSWF